MSQITRSRFGSGIRGKTTAADGPAPRGSAAPHRRLDSGSSSDAARFLRQRPATCFRKRGIAGPLRHLATIWCVVDMATKSRFPTWSMLVIVCCTLLTGLHIGLLSEGRGAFSGALVSFGLAGLGFVRVFTRAPAQLYWLAFGVAVVHVCITMSLYDLNGQTPYYIGGSDDVAYEAEGAYLSETKSWLSPFDIGERLEKPVHNSEGYTYLLVIMHKASEQFGGFSTSVPRLLNACAVSATACCVFELCLLLGTGIRSAKRAALITAINPMVLFVASHTFRDILIGLLVTIQAVAATRYVSSAKSRDFVMMAACLPLMLPMRALGSLILEASFCFALLARATSFKWPRFVLVAMTAALVVITAAGVSGVGQRFYEQLLDALIYYEEYLRIDQSSGIVRGLMSLPFPANQLARLGIAVVSPIPIFHIANIHDFLWNCAATSSVIQVVLLPFVIRGIAINILRPAWWPLIVAFVVAFGAYAIGTMTFRHIVVYWPLLSVLAVSGARHQGRAFPALLCGTLATFGIGIGLYFEFVRQIR